MLNKVKEQDLNYNLKIFTLLISKMSKNIVIDLINIDHCYISIEKNSVYGSDTRKLGNVRPYINNNRIDITNNDKYELITQYNNPTDFSYESWLAIYIDKYIKYAEYSEGDIIVFVIPRNFDIAILSSVMTMLNYSFYYVYDYYAAVYYTYNKSKKYAAVIPNEYETAIVYVDNKNIVKIQIVKYGSNYIKEQIQNFFAEYDITISLNEAWSIYQMLQVNSSVDISQIVMSLEKPIIMERVNLTSIISEFYNEILCIRQGYTIAPFRWIGRDYVINNNYKLITTYNADEAVCIGAQNYVTDGGELNKISKSEVDFFDLNYLNHYINLNNEFNVLVNNIEQFFIDNKIESIDIDLTKESMKNCIKYLRKHNAPDNLIRDTCKLFWNI